MDSPILCFCGPRGSGKSASAALLAVMHIMAGGNVVSNATITVKPEDIKRISAAAAKRNMDLEEMDDYEPVEDDEDFNDIAALIASVEGQDEEDLPLQTGVSEELDVIKLVTQHQDLNNKLIVADEIQNIMDSTRSMTTMSRLIYLFASQSRKFHAAFAYTIMNPLWVNARLRAMTDFTIFCQDVAKSPYGREHRIKEGEFCTWHIFDSTGQTTGQIPFMWPGFYLGKRTVALRSIWECYDTEQKQDVWEAYRKIKVLQPVEEIDPFGIRDTLDSGLLAPSLSEATIDEVEMLESIDQGIKAAAVTPGMSAETIKKMMKAKQNLAARVKAK